MNKVLGIDKNWHTTIYEELVYFMLFRVGINIYIYRNLISYVRPAPPRSVVHNYYKTIFETTTIDLLCGAPCVSSHL